MSVLDDNEERIEQLATDLARAGLYDTPEDARLALVAALTSDAPPYRVAGVVVRCRWPHWLCKLTRHRFGPHDMPHDWEKDVSGL